MMRAKINKLNCSSLKVTRFKDITLSPSLITNKKSHPHPNFDVIF